MVQTSTAISARPSVTSIAGFAVLGVAVLAVAGRGRRAVGRRCSVAGLGARASAPPAGGTPAGAPGRGVAGGRRGRVLDVELAHHLLELGRRDLRAGRGRDAATTAAGLGLHVDRAALLDGRVPRDAAEPLQDARVAGA